MIYYILKIGRKRMTDRMNEWMNHGCGCRTARATPGLLNMDFSLISHAKIYIIQIVIHFEELTILDKGVKGQVWVSKRIWKFQENAIDFLCCCCFHGPYNAMLYYWFVRSVFWKCKLKGLNDISLLFNSMTKNMCYKSIFWLTWYKNFISILTSQF